MNRRKFFGMSAAAVLAAGLPLSVLPERTIFLPPRSGLWTSWSMREAVQYLINTDSVVLRFDIGWGMRNGEQGQVYWDAPEIPYADVAARHPDHVEHDDFVSFYRHAAEIYREDARKALMRLVPLGARPRDLYLPRTAMYAARV